MGICIASILAILILLIVFIRSPWGQEIIVEKAVSFVSEKTKTKVAIDRLFVTFSGNIYLEGLYLESTTGDTLLYSKNLEAGLAILPLIQSGAINVSKLEWEGLKANISRTSATQKFNYEFLIDAFIPQSGEVLISQDSIPQADSQALQISLSPISIRDFELSYLDEVLGIEASLLLGSLEVEVPTLDLEKANYRISKLSLQNTTASYTQTKPFEPAEEDTTASLLPSLILDQLELQNITVNYTNTVDQQRAELGIGNFTFQAPEVNLQEQQLNVSLIDLKNSNILFHDFGENEVATTVPNEDPAPFQWPDWTVDISKISLENNSIEFKTADLQTQKGYFNPEVILLEKLRLSAENIFLKNQEAGLKLSKAGFKEASGFELKEFQVEFAVSDTESQLENLLIQTNRSQLAGSAKFLFSSIQELIDQPETIDLDLSIQKTSLDVRDSYFFAPELAADTLIRQLSLSPFEIQLDLKGSLQKLTIPNANLRWNESDFSAKGQVVEALNADQLSFDFPEIQLKTNRKTLIQFVDETQLGVSLPENLSLTANASGDLSDVLAKLNLQTDLGNMLLDGNFKSEDQLAFNVDLTVDQLQLGAILDNPALDTLSLQLAASGNGSSLNDLNAVLTSSFERLRINGNDYSGLALDGKLQNGKGDIHLWLSDEFLDFDLLTNLDLDSSESQVDLTLDLKGIDLYELGFAGKSTRAKFLLQSNFIGNLSSFDLKTQLRDALVVFDQRSYPMGQLDLQARIREDSTSVSLESLILNGSLRSNASPDSLILAITDHFKQHLDATDSIRNPSGNVTMVLDFAINQAPILNQVLLPGLEQLDSARIKVDFNQREDRLLASVNFPYVKYGTSEIDSLGIRINSDTEDLDLAFGFLALNSGPLSMDRTYFTGELQDSRLYFDFNSFQGEELSYHIASDIGYTGDTLSIHISPENLLVNSLNWSIPNDNLVQIGSQYVHLEEFRFSRENQELFIRDDLEDITEEHLAIQFGDFKLETFVNLLNPNESIAAGSLNGRLVLENPFSATGLLGDLKIDSLTILEIPLGNLSLNASSETLGDYILALSLKDGGMDLDLEGGFKADEAGGTFDIQLNLNQIDMEVIAGLSGGELKDASGFVSGQINANGTTLEPLYSGEVTFNEAAFNVAQLNSKYLLADETIKLDNSGIYLDNFTFQDEKANSFQIDGAVLTESFINPSFDLKLKADNFSVVNSTREDNDLFYGKGIIDADVSITGDLVLPKVQANLTVKKATELTFIVPESQLDLVERQGVVVFVNRNDPNDILTRAAEETSNTFVGYDIRAILQTDPEASFRVIVDERSGDNLLVSGEADLNLEINPNGRITLSGNYEIQEGHYEMSLYNLVSRKFAIAQGSRITWNGDPMDASLAISAIYEIRTSSSELMSAQLTSSSGGSRTQYLQELPFLVYLNVNGELLRPEISFRLDMPEAQRGALGGNVYSRVLQVNEQEGELNKQVFSLLVLNRFFPSTGSDGSGGGTAAIARSSASQVLSGQLNALSSKLLGNSGIELDFDLDSFTDYQGNSPQERTQLNVSARKQLFDDRLVVQVGSQVDIEGSSQNPQQGNALLGNVSIEYLLTKNGRYRLRGFQRNEFQSIIDGPLIVTGFGVIFNREFNTFRELWNRSVENQNKVNPIDELEKKNGPKEETKDNLDSSKKDENDD